MDHDDDDDLGGGKVLFMAHIPTNTEVFVNSNASSKKLEQALASLSNSQTLVHPRRPHMYAAVILFISQGACARGIMGLYVS